MADGSAQLLLALGGFPEAVGVQVNAGAAGDVGRPAAEHGVAEVGPAVVDPVLTTEQNKTVD